MAVDCGSLISRGRQRELWNSTRAVLLHYPSIGVAIERTLQVGPAILLSKLDIKDAYRIVPVHPDDWPLLGMRWKGQYYVDTTLSFGFRSAPKLFTALADALVWVTSISCTMQMSPQPMSPSVQTLQEPEDLGHGATQAFTGVRELGHSPG